VDGRLWPWGNELPTAEHCNFNRNVKTTTSVGKYSPKGDSPYGCVDMAGNVWEWTGSWYNKDSTRALRGGSWSLSDRLTRAAFRYYNDHDGGGDNVGFRVAELRSDPDS
jgi:formylglycine-generating enzyme required for sulfatase activity